MLVLRQKIGDGIEVKVGDKVLQITVVERDRQGKILLGFVGCRETFRVVRKNAKKKEELFKTLTS